MPLTTHFHQDGTRYRYAVLQDGQEIATMEGDYAFGGKLMAVHRWAGDIGRADVQAALASHSHVECAAQRRDALIHLTPEKQPLCQAFLDAGFQLRYHNLLFRTQLENLLPPSHTLSLIPIVDIPSQEYAALFHACTIGDPKEPQVLQEAPAEYWERFRAELDTLYVPELAFAARAQDQVVGVLHMRVAPGQDRVVGFMNYIGIHPSHRGQGWGTDLHRMGMLRLQAMGCTEYIGSTPDTNRSMQQVFQRNAVPLWARQAVLAVGP